MVTYDKKINNLFLSWLILSLILILIMIIVGGLTRLTNSGLSITEWELFKGIFPPFTNSDWQIYFNLYKEIPQFKLMNPLMSLDEFKIIFYWEYAHRVLGRIIGLFVLIPLIFFQFYKKIKFNKLIPSYIVFLLVLLQGTVGWYMVQSGLVNNVTVSHYRLSLHLTLAILIISIIFWQILNFKNDKLKPFFKSSKKNIPYIILIFLIYIQVILGAFVSGLDAGSIYQTWPLMGNNYFPDDVDKNLNDLLNFENHSVIQFYHRNFAYLLTLYIIFLTFFTLRMNNRLLYRPLLLLNIILLTQIFLGVFTLLSNLNINLASAHQLSSVIFVLSALNLYYSVIK